jgi:hydrogenase maturation protease
VPHTLVLGLGNILMRDEGIGVRAVELLAARYEFPPEVELLDGGTLGLNLLPYVEEADRLLVIDAVDTGGEPGTVVRLESEELPASLSIKISPHQMGLADLLAAARLRGCCPRELVLVGVQPGVIDTGLELSPPVAAQVASLVEAALSQLSRWGIEWTMKLLPEKEGDDRWK